MKYKTEYQMLNVADIISVPYNPREDIVPGSEEYEALRRSISEHGLAEPLVVNLHNMRCVGGNQRLTVIRDLGWSQVLCSVINQPNERQEKKLCLALNRISGRWNSDKLAELLNDEDVLNYTTGFTETEIALYQQLKDVPEPEIEKTLVSDLAMLAEPGSCNELNEMTVTVKIGHLHFKCEAVLYERLLGDIRSAGIFEKNQIIQEIKRRILSDD